MGTLAERHVDNPRAHAWHCSVIGVVRRCFAHLNEATTQTQHSWADGYDHDDDDDYGGDEAAAPMTEMLHEQIELSRARRGRFANQAFLAGRIVVTPKCVQGDVPGDMVLNTVLLINPGPCIAIQPT